MSQKSRRVTVRSFHTQCLNHETLFPGVRKTLALPMIFDTFASYIESLFYDNRDDGRPMTWGNRGEWDLHHKKALDRFNLYNPADARAARRARNVEPLWLIDHVAKHSRRIRRENRKRRALALFVC